MTDLGQDITAAELALGLLEGEERAAALRRTLAEPAFAREVDEWRQHFGALFARWPEAHPPMELAARLERSLAPAKRPSYVWPAVAAASAAIAASVGTVLVLRPSEVTHSTPTQAETLVASLTGDFGTPVPVVYLASVGQLRTPAMPLRLQRRSAELWMIGADGVPHSLGVMDATKPAVITLSSQARELMGPGIKLAVSSEPAGGSTTGLPTGPILASGALVSV